MARALFQVLVILYKYSGGKIYYAVFKRSDSDIRQGVSGGGENEETPEDAAIRELYEEAGILLSGELIRLQTESSVPCYHFKSSLKWGEEKFVVREYAFGAEAGEKEIVLSGEHECYEWADYEEAVKLLTFDSNKTALWELNNRLLNKKPWEK